MLRPPSPLPLLALLAAWPTIARGQDKTAAAHALFDEGKKLVDAGDFAAACPKFKASLDLEVKLGTRLALAACLEKIGRHASAWAEFRDAAAMAGRMGAAEAPREKYALDHAAALEGKLVRMTIHAPAGVTVRRDGEPVPPVSFGTPVPVDPGPHEVVASAEGYEPWARKMTVGGEPVTVTVPPLKKLEPPPAPIPPPVPPPVPAAAPAPVPTPAPESETPAQRYLGYGVGAAGVVLVGVGLAFGASASSKWSDAKAMCSGGSPLQCTPAGVALHDDAVSAARLSTIATVGGAAAIAGGVILILTASESPAPPPVSLQLAPTGAAVVVAGDF
jgi:hypothetical protein